ncbi:hypothetical protein V501_01053 [Pseudogymnoascus sp. VKM F-4519 (FW-2642)]|nr:hypothetical protein V501_01053 [Pseudogymnoascus sp. VKM F-4519 (FW-2642)]
MSSDTKADDRAGLNVVAKVKGLRESPIQDDKLLLKKQCQSSPMSGPDNLSLLPTELKTQILFEISDRKTLLNLSEASEVFRAVFDGRKGEFFLSAYAEEFRRGELSPSDANDALCRLETQDRDTLVLSLYTIYDHVVLETSWAAWAGAIKAIDYLAYHSDKAEVLSIRMEPWILGQFALRQGEIIGQGVPEGQQDNAHYVLEALQHHHETHRRREEKRRLEWKHFERKKKHINNLTEVLQAMLHLEVQKRQWFKGYKRVADLMLLEDQGRPGRHADFHGGVQCICDPSTCRHTADADDLYRVLEEICTNLISQGDQLEAYEAITGFGRIPRYYEHIAAERLQRARSLWHDKWPNDLSKWWDTK